MNCKDCRVEIPEQRCRCGHLIERCRECAHKLWKREYANIVRKMAQDIADDVDRKIIEELTKR